MGQLTVVGGTADLRSAVADLGAAAAWITADAVRRDELWSCPAAAITTRWTGPTGDRATPDVAGS